MTIIHLTLYVTYQCTEYSKLKNVLNIIHLLYINIISYIILFKLSLCIYTSVCEYIEKDLSWSLTRSIQDNLRIQWINHRERKLNSQNCETLISRPTALTSVQKCWLYSFIRWNLIHVNFSFGGYVIVAVDRSLLYADDTILYCTCNDIEEEEENISLDNELNYIID